MDWMGWEDSLFYFALSCSRMIGDNGLAAMIGGEESSVYEYSGSMYGGER